MRTEAKDWDIQGRSKQVKKSVRKKRRKNRLIKILLVVFALLYIPALWNWIFHGGIETDILHTGVLELTIPAEGVFIRDEVSIRVPRDGIVVPKVNSGERVPNQYEFAILIDETGQQTLQKIKELEENIIRQVAESNPGSLDEDSEFCNQVQNEVNKLSKLAVTKSFIQANGIKAALERLLYQRNKEVFQGKGDRLYLKNEKNELELLKQSLDERALPITSQFSGLVVWDDQSLNEKYFPSGIDQLSLDDLSLGKRQSQENQLLSAGIDSFFPIKKEQDFARLVNNEKSWYVCVVDSKKAVQLRPGTSLSLKMDALKDMIPCHIESIVPMGDKTKVVLSFNQMVENTIHLRNEKADLVAKNIEGLKIPARSLVNRNIHDSTADIILVRFNRAVVKRVLVVAEQDTFAVISTLEGSKETDPVSIFDIYVVNPQNIEEGQVID